MGVTLSHSIPIADLFLFRKKKQVFNLDSDDKFCEMNVEDKQFIH